MITMSFFEGKSIRYYASDSLNTVETTKNLFTLTFSLAQSRFRRFWRGNKALERQCRFTAEFVSSLKKRDNEGDWSRVTW